MMLSFKFKWTVKIIVSQFAKAMENRLRNVGNGKRVFGKDITNIQRRGKVHSISEKPMAIVETRTKSRSFDRKVVVEPRDPLVEYEQEILAFMLSLQQREKREKMIAVTPDMRQILVDWLIDVHGSFQLKEQTLFLALAYLNQFCATEEVGKQEYQLVGIACLWIASKFQEIYPPRMQNFIQVTDCSYSLNELKAMEGRILLALRFNLNHTTPLSILEVVAEKWPRESNGKLSKQSQRTLAMTKYLIELALFEGLGKEYCMKTLVLSALMLSDSVLKVKTETRVLDSEGIQKEVLMRCFKDMCLGLQNISRPNLKLKAIKKKYADEKYLGVSRFRIEQK